jgi:hypothetical protein
MKYIVLVLIAVLAGCAYVDGYFYIQIGSGFDLYSQDEYAELRTPRAIAQYISENVVYKYEGEKDEWTGPKETVRRGYGDCDDIALLFANVAYFGIGVKCNIIATTVSSYDYDMSIVNGGFPNHIAVEINGQTYEPFYGYPVNCDIQYRYTFDEVFKQ